MKIIFLKQRKNLPQKIITLNLETLEAINTINLYIKDNLNIVAQLPNNRDLSKELIVSLGKECIKFIKNNNIENLLIDTHKLDLEIINMELFLKNLILNSYEFDNYKNSNKIHSEIYILEKKNLEKVISKIKIQTNAIKFVKDLINTPANEMKASDFIDIAKSCSKRLNFDINIFSEEEILKNKMNGIYTVGKGSVNKSRVLILKYKGDILSNDSFGIVGKGITFDSGGYSLKPTSSMVNMKNDMGGAAVSLGVLCAIAEERLKINITVIIPLCENMISNEAYKPGDIIKMMSGCTVEIENTDCEGRVILADAIYYLTFKESISKFLTIATLTGGAYNTFGEYMTPIFSNDDKFYEKILNAANQTEELIWRMPLEKMYKRFITGNLADLKNSGGKVGGLISSALFLNEFNYGNKSWCHLDIAGNVINSTNRLASGKTVELIYNLIKNEVKN
ncbi:M17 family metallopeptidase [Cetobacterium sp.]|uniref:M17 family metallopeptidase n=1 Tax=Cetobacterium sp. TaxID=2071632 RepID=UPI003EE5F535